MKWDHGRIEIWKMTLNLIAKKPMLGCGPDNLKKGLFISCKYEAIKFYLRNHTVVDKAHNEYLNIAATIGVPALILYLTFLSLILLPKLKNKSKLNYIFVLVIISYLAQAFFNISTIGVAPLFWMILGLSDNQYIDRNCLKQKNIRNNK